MTASSLSPRSEGGAVPEFAFFVHPLSATHRRVVAVRRANPTMFCGLGGPIAPGVLCELQIPDVVRGRVVVVDRMPAALLENQIDAVDEMVRAAESLGTEVTAIGLGSLLAVVGGRGTGLSDRISRSVTTGAAATAWAAAENARVVLDALGEESVAVLGFAGTVGELVARLLARSGVRVTVVGRGRRSARRARELDLQWAETTDAVGAFRVVVGASTTGGILEAGAVAPGTVLLDVALPPTLVNGHRARGVTVLAGEALALPAGWRRGFWGSIYHLLAGYGPHHVFACLVEPLVMAAIGRNEPFALGRRVELADVDAFGEAALGLGFRPRLSRGWRGVEASSLVGSRPLLPEDEG